MDPLHFGVHPNCFQVVTGIIAFVFISSDDALILLTRPHKGPVKGLQVNPFQPFLVASGSTDSEVFLLFYFLVRFGYGI